VLRDTTVTLVIAAASDHSGSADFGSVDMLGLDDAQLADIARASLRSVGISLGFAGTRHHAGTPKLCRLASPRHDGRR